MGVMVGVVYSDASTPLTSGLEPANLSNALLDQLAQLAYSGGTDGDREDKRREKQEKQV